jgi:hypothetical protein
LQIKEKNGIIEKQSTMIKIAFGIAATAITYTIYKEVK